MSEHINPVMYTDYSGFFRTKDYLIGVGITLVVVTALVFVVPTGGASAAIGYTIVAAIGASGVLLSYGNAADAQIAMDISYSDSYLGGILTGTPGGGKIGLSMVVDFERETIEVFPHSGGFIGYSDGLSFSTGIIHNYDSEEGYTGHFVYGEGTYYAGGGHCWDPSSPYTKTTKAYYLDFSFSKKPGSLNTGYDYYYDSLIRIDWGN
jgi:hypothetical protein